MIWTIATTLPTLMVVVSMVMNDRLLTRLQRHMNERFDAIDHRFAEQAATWHSEMFRFEQVLDARLKHLEEHR